VQIETGAKDPSRMLDVPSVMGRSHNRTQKEMAEKKTPPETPNFRMAAGFLKVRVFDWVWHYLRSRLGARHDFLTYKSGTGDNGIYDIAAGANADEAVRVAIVGDWASGTSDADQVARAMEQGNPHYTIHLGDIYFVGAKPEVLENMLGGRVRFPLGTRGSFALNANHEMYARGIGYFRDLLPKLGMRDQSNGAAAGQKASFFCLRTNHWLVIGLDTGYNSVGTPFIEKIFKPSAKLHDDQLRWLRDVVRIREDRLRGIILLSHHQYYSQFEHGYEAAAQQLSEMIDRPVLWLWGHEHRLALYRKHATSKGRLQVYGRCMGHGGLPMEDIAGKPKTDAKDDVGLVFYDRRERSRIGDNVAVGFNGYANLTFQGNTLTIEHRDVFENAAAPDSRTLVREQWSVGAGGELRGQSIERLVADAGLVVHTGRQLEDAIR
jgi:hypothetical protein